MRCRVWVMSGLAAFIAVSGAALAEAQGRLVGVVYDSVAAKPLSAAFVQFALMSDPRVSRSVRADERGRYRVDSLEPGTWVMAVMHPRVDSLGIEQLARQVTANGKGEQRANIAIPSPRSLVRGVCGDTARLDGSGYLYGKLSRLNGGASATRLVDVEWVDMMVSVTKGVGVTYSPRHVMAAPHADGAFTVCGVPPGGTVRVRGLDGTDTTGTVELTVPEHGIARVELAVGAVRHELVDSMWVRRGDGVLRGRVVGLRGEPLPNVGVSVWGSGAAAARTDAEGNWQLKQLPSGTHTVETRAFGFQAQRTVVHIGDEATGDLVDTLARVATLDTVRTRGLREELFTRELRGFDKRRQIGLGTFRGPVDLDQIMPNEAAHLMRPMPGIKVRPAQESSLQLGNRILLRGGVRGTGCVPDLIVDRLRIHADRHDGFLDHWVRFAEVRAIEVYHSITITPAEFIRPGNDCGTVVLWTGGK